jgi:hypothetical protein
MGKIKNTANVTHAATNGTKRLPSHRVYAVTKREERNFWREIGAAWEHEDGEGFNIRLNLLPLDGSDIVVRKPRPKDEADQD